MKIISAKDYEGNDIRFDEIEKDRPELERRHKELVKKDGTWAFFGGTLHIGKKVYQVVPEGSVRL